MQKSTPHLFVRADASSAIGSGHVMRCLALSKAWQQSGGDISWLLAESIPAVEDRLRREGFTLNTTRATPGSDEDVEQTAAQACAAHADWVVVDGYRFSPDYLGRLKSSGTRVLFLDDDGRFDFYPSDVVLNQNISANAAMYAQRAPETHLLLGSEYVLLRPEFLVDHAVPEHPKIARKILVTMGGSDPGNTTHQVLLAFAALNRDFQAKVVVGGGNSRFSELLSLSHQLGPHVELLPSQDNMAPLMRWADVAISGAGGTCWELAFTGLPAIVIALSNDQRGIAQGLADRGIAISLGWHATLSKDQISGALDRLLDDHSQRVSMSERGQRLIDGRGASRVVQYLQNLL